MLKKQVRVLKKCGQPCNIPIARVYSQLLSCALRLDEMKKALKYSFKHIRWLKSTDSEDDQLAEALLLQGLLQLEAGQLETAIDHFEQALPMLPLPRMAYCA